MEEYLNFRLLCEDAAACKTFSLASTFSYRGVAL